MILKRGWRPGRRVNNYTVRAFAKKLNGGYRRMVELWLMSRLECDFVGLGPINFRPYPEPILMCPLRILALLHVMTPFTR